jgi:uncharacterized lipoprotein
MARSNLVLLAVTLVALSGCSMLGALVPPANNDADSAASYVVQVCALPAGQRAAALDAMNKAVAPRSIELNCP